MEPGPASAGAPVPAGPLDSTDLLRRAAHLGRVGGWGISLPGQEVYWSEQIFEILEWPDGHEPALEEAIGLYRRDHQRALTKAVTRCMADGTPFDMELQLRTAGGRPIWARVVGAAERDAGGAIVRVAGAFQDVTHRRTTEDEVARLSERLTATFEGMTEALYLLDADWRFVYVNPQAERLLERSREELMGTMVWDEFPEARGTIVEDRLRRAAARDEQTRFEVHYEPLGQWFEVTAYPSPEGLAVSFRSTTAEREAAEVLAREEERFRFIARATADAVWDWDVVADSLWWSSGMQALFGHAQEELEPDSSSWTSRIHPDDRERVSAHIRTTLEGDAGEWDAEYRFQRRDGSYATVTDRGFVIRDAAGRARRMVGGMRDVTEQRSLQEQLRQAQRLEALGQLTGGVAHDFNNLLTVILGNAELLKDDLTGCPELRELAEMTAAAARRGAELTRGLLAFARRQALAPRPVDVNVLVRGMEPLLRRTLGSDVAVVTVLGAGVRTALVDASQLEVALLNLAINARDAMEGGGSLVISTADVDVDAADPGVHRGAAPGGHVLVTVRDTGSGIAPEDLARVFDPFFTTKGVGRGSGLGLSMVYGFVNQSRGHVAIASEPGEGTTVRMYLPRAAGVAEAEPASPPGVAAGGGETVLLVEDDPMVRRYARARLTALGYRVLDAGRAEEALAVLARPGHVDLMLADVEMPGMNGRELADAARAARPGLRVLLTSGHAAPALRRDDTLPVLGKPYGRDELAARVREALDG